MLTIRPLSGRATFLMFAAILMAPLVASAVLSSPPLTQSSGAASEACTVAASIDGAC